jgi:hypothetical protein
MTKINTAGLKRFHFRVLGVFLVLTLTLSLFSGISVRADGLVTDSGSAPYASISGNITIAQNDSITFTITGDAYYVVGTSGVIDGDQWNRNGNQCTCGVSAIGEVGSSTGLYLVAPGQAPQKFCVITVGPPKEVAPPPPVNTTHTAISYSDNYYYLRFEDLKQNEMMYSEISVSDPSLSLSIASNNENVVQVLPLQKEPENPGHYATVVRAVGEGYTTLTITASDGTVDNMPVIVKGSIGKDYTLSSDTTRDFSIPQNGSYFLMLNYTYTGPSYNDPTAHYGPLSTPLLVSDNPDIKVTLVSQKGTQFLFRIDAFGAVGESAGLITGSYNYQPENLCRVSISAPPKSIRLDTSGVYTCETGGTYDFVAYTSSTSPPAASTTNELVTVKFVKKVSGGYQYRMTVNNPNADYRFMGTSLVRVRQGNETVSFPVNVDNSEPTVKSDTMSVVKLYKGQSYIYKFTIMGGEEPSFGSVYDAVPVEPGSGILDVQLVKKDGPNYYVKVTATSANIGDRSYIYVKFSRFVGGYDSVSTYGAVEIGPNPAKPVIPMKSDTTKDFTLAENRSYIFKLTGVAQFTAQYSGDFRIELLSRTGNDSYYRVTPNSIVGVHNDFFMYNGYTTQKVCTVTIGEPIPMKSDTTQNFSLARGKSYTFKVTGATGFNSGTAGVFTTELVKRSGLDSYYKITAVGPSGSSSGMYMGDGIKPVRVCTVSIV